MLASCHRQLFGIKLHDLLSGHKHQANIVIHKQLLFKYIIHLQPSFGDLVSNNLVPLRLRNKFGTCSQNK